jgi:hypothetical protein
MKLPFPYEFMDSKDKMNYNGTKPDFSYYKDITVEEYDKILSNWNAKDETIKYLERDCLLIYEIVYKLLSNINNNYGLDV